MKETNEQHKYSLTEIRTDSGFFLKGLHREICVEYDRTGIIPVGSTSIRLMRLIIKK